MALETGISYVKSSLNLWIGCTQIGPGCDACYAMFGDIRFHGGKHWGPGAPRHRTAKSNWKQAETWNRKAAASGEFWPVFCNTQADIFDNEVPKEWRDDAWALFARTPNLTWFLVTKRIGNAPRMLPPDWGTGYPNVWIIATVVNQEEAERDIPKLASIDAAVKGISHGPGLGPLDLSFRLRSGLHEGERAIDLLDWIITEGESRQGRQPREYRLEWPESLAEQASAAGVPFFMKQMGHFATRSGERVKFTGKGADATEWPEALRRQEFPGGRLLVTDPAPKDGSGKKVIPIVPIAA
jgi:protein gp37